jgi:hypothetical protein
MKYKLTWSGLADDNYFNVIAKYCLPSWIILPGNKNIVSDSNVINISGISVTGWDLVENKNSNFLKTNPSKKTWNFWRKMQSQVWAAKNFKKENDFVILLDTDIEITNFNFEKFELELDNFLESNLPWATGRSQSRLHDSGFIILNARHPMFDELIDHYENIWENGTIHTLEKGYDGNAVESMFEKYPSYKIMNTDYGRGLHVYDLGLVHYGSKLPKALRAENPTKSGKELVEIYTKNIVVKKYKN